jgi:hypothetical protein
MSTTSFLDALDGWARFSVVSVCLPNGQLVQREIEDHGSAVAVLAFDPERKTAILVQHFRAPPFFLLGQEHTLEAIAGIQEDADSITTARREALEEAVARYGLALGDLRSRR